MKVSSILAISVILYLHNRAVFINILGLNMKVSSILVISVTFKLLRSRIFRNILSINMKVKEGLEYSKRRLSNHQWW